jgi:hypothetical protein
VGLRSTIKNALGGGLQQTSLDEAAAQTGTIPQQSQVLASAAGAGPDAVKMIGTPQQTAGAIQRTVRTAAQPTVQDTKSAIAQSQQQGAQASQQAAGATQALSGLPAAMQRVAELVKQQALGQQAKAATDTMTFDQQALAQKVGPANAARAEELTRKALTGSLSTVESAELTGLLKPGAKAGETFSLDDLKTFVRDASTGAPIDVARQLLGSLDPNATALSAISDADAKQLGFPGGLSDLAAAIQTITGKDLSQVKVADLPAAVQAFNMRTFKDVGAMQATLANPAASPAAKAAALDRLKLLGYQNVLTEQERAGDLQKQIEAGTTVKIGGLQIPVAEITSNPELLAKIAPALQDTPEGRLALDKLKAEDPALAAWAEKNKPALMPVVAGAQDEIDALVNLNKQNRAALGGESFLQNPQAAKLLQDAGIDPTAMTGQPLDISKFKEPARTIIRAQVAAQNLGDPRARPVAEAKVAKLLETYDSMMADPYAKTLAADPKLLDAIASLPNDAASNVKAYAELAPMRQYFQRASGGGLAAPATVAPVLGLDAKAVSAGIQGLTSPALGAARTKLQGELGLTGDPALANMAALNTEMKRLSTLAGNPQASLADRIDAQKKLKTYGAYLKGLDIRSPEAQQLVAAKKVEDRKVALKSPGKFQAMPPEEKKLTLLQALDPSNPDGAKQLPGVWGKTDQAGRKFLYDAIQAGKADVDQLGEVITGGGSDKDKAKIAALLVAGPAGFLFSATGQALLKSLREGAPQKLAEDIARAGEEVGKKVVKGVGKAASKTAEAVKGIF